MLCTYLTILLIFLTLSLPLLYISTSAIEFNICKTIDHIGSCKYLVIRLTTSFLYSDNMFVELGFSPQIIFMIDKLL